MTDETSERAIDQIIDQEKIEMTVDDTVEHPNIHEEIEGSERTVKTMSCMVDDVKQYYSQSVQKMDQKYQDKLNTLKFRLDKHHLDLIAQMNAHKALVDSDIEAFRQEMAAG